MQQFHGGKRLVAGAILAVMSGLYGASAGAEESAFQQDAAGIVAIEAENFHRMQTALSRAWSFDAQVGDHSGAGYMAVNPDTDMEVSNRLAKSAPFLEYRIHFQRSGTHYVWIRGLAPNKGASSLRVGLNDETPAVLEIEPRERWIWGHKTWSISQGKTAVSPLELDVPSAGVHTVRVYLREDGLLFDKLLLTPANRYKPAGTGAAESSETPGDGGSGGGNPPPEPDATPVAVNDAATTTFNSAVDVPVLANDGGLTDGPVSVQVTTAPAHGVITPLAANALRYTPASNYIGADQFSYQVRDRDGDTATATVRVTVLCATCAPDVNLKLSWLPSDASTLGYKVYFGSTANGAATPVGDYGVRSGLIDPAAPAIQIKSRSDLGLYTSGNVCFRVRAYNAAGDSPYSPGICTRI